MVLFQQLKAAYQEAVDFQRDCGERAGRKWLLDKSHLELVVGGDVFLRLELLRDLPDDQVTGKKIVEFLYPDLNDEGAESFWLEVARVRRVEHAFALGFTRAALQALDEVKATEQGS